ncbi:MAG: sigma-70 family RNA polymerase sigma factor [Oscillospiraceae bacterium]
MTKKVSFDHINVDAELFKLVGSGSQDDEVDTKLKSIAKKALSDIISEQLSEKQRQYLVLYYYEQHTMTDISEICGVNVSTVSRTISRAKKNIVDRIKYYFIK